MILRTALDAATTAALILQIRNLRLTEVAICLRTGSMGAGTRIQFAPRAWALDHCAAPPFSPMLIILLWIQSFCQVFGTVGKFWCVTFDVEELIQDRSFIRMLKQALIILFRGLTAASYFRPALNLFLEGPSFKLRLIDSKWCSS